MLIALMLVAAQPAVAPPAAAPPATAVALGERLARTGTLAVLLPLQAGKETDEMVAQNPTLSVAEQATLRRVAKATYDSIAARLFAAEGRRYAELLSETDLRALVAHAESPAATRLRGVQPQAIMTVMGAMAGVDYKAQTRDAFCRETGKLCPAAPRP